MDSPQLQLSLVKKMFPAQKEKIEALYKEDADFRALCHDYFLCMRYLDKFHNEFSEKLSNISEYENARRLLEEELAAFMKKDPEAEL